LRLSPCPVVAGSAHSRGTRSHPAWQPRRQMAQAGGSSRGGPSRSQPFRGRCIARADRSPSCRTCSCRPWGPCTYRYCSLCPRTGPSPPRPPYRLRRRRCRRRKRGSGTTPRQM
jgi:hypothetical protein